MNLIKRGTLILVCIILILIGLNGCSESFIGGSIDSNCDEGSAIVSVNIPVMDESNCDDLNKKLIFALSNDLSEDDFSFVGVYYRWLGTSGDCGSGEVYSCTLCNQGWDPAWRIEAQGSDHGTYPEEWDIWSAAKINVGSTTLKFKIEWDSDSVKVTETSGNGYGTQTLEVSDFNLIELIEDDLGSYGVGDSEITSTLESFECKSSFEEPPEDDPFEVTEQGGIEIYSYDCNLGFPEIGLPCEGEWSCNEWSSCIDDEGNFDSSAIRYRECFTDCPVTESDEPSMEEDCSQEDSCEDKDNDGYGIGVNSLCDSEFPDCDDEDEKINPSAEEVCDGKDNNCDGSIDEECPCLEGDFQECGKEEGICTSGNQMCLNGKWSICTGGIDPVAEICDDGLDNDCDGALDEGCSCSPGDKQECGTDVGECKSGIQTCTEEGIWGVCDGEITGFDENCGDGKDNDCDGYTDGNDDNCPDAGGTSGTDTCDDGIWNQDEDGTDCGGSCKTGKEQICDDLIDNDNDCKVDCFDVDCFGSKLCENEDRPDEESENDADGDGIIDSIDDEPYCNNNNYCDSYEGTDCKDCDEENSGGFLIVFIVLLIILILLGGGYWYLKKKKGGTGKKITLFGKKKNTDLNKNLTKKPNLKLSFKMPKTKTSFDTNMMDDKIKKSMEEANKILKKK